jgi:hypothetical protein
MFWVRGILEGGGEDGICFGRGLWGTATDVSTIGETRRGREGNSWDVGLGFEVVCSLERGLEAVFEGLRELLLRGEGGPSDSRESASMHASRSQSDAAFGSSLVLFSNRGMCVTKGMGSGRTGGG